MGLSRLVSLLMIVTLAPLVFAADRREYVNLDGSITVKEEASASEFTGPTAMQSAELAIHKLNEVNGAVTEATNPNAVDCPGPKVSVTREGESKSVAVCMLTEQEFADYQKRQGQEVITWEFNTSNDANPSNYGQKYDDRAVDRNKSLNDDVGRTFEIELKRRAENKDGYVEMRGKSTAFGQRTGVGGRSLDSEKHAYMKLFSVTSFTVEKGTKLPGEQRGVSDYIVNEGSVEVSTGKDKSLLGTQTQKWFHQTTKSGPIYHYVDHEKMKVRAVLKTGLQRVIESDLGKFRCKMMATGLVGIGTDGRPLAESRVGASISTGSMGGRASDNPWIQLDGYRKHLIRAGARPEEESGVRVTSSAQVLGTTVKPFIGVARFDSALDRKYSAGSRGGREPIYSMGVMVQWK